uniref:Uncharacterized protein n=1 Tax=Meloidogyne enterolobii TaxID=390850 RepID=A0A6V7WID6_MELEN|nr:unnamed protein product [Meloidogyne enterolobii]
MFKLIGSNHLKLPNDYKGKLDKQSVCLTKFLFKKYGDPDSIVITRKPERAINEEAAILAEQKSVGNKDEVLYLNLDQTIYHYFTKGDLNDLKKCDKIFDNRR